MNNCFLSSGLSPAGVACFAFWAGLVSAFVGVADGFCFKADFFGAGVVGFSSSSSYESGDRCNEKRKI